jgi:O-antigen/teichoic acid export membrane protein
MIDINRKSLFNNISSNYLLVAFISISSFISTIIFSRILGPDNYGVYTYLVWLTSTLSAFSGLGLTGTIAKFFPEYFLNYRFDQAKKFIKTTFLIQIVVVLVVILILFVSMPLWKEKLLSVKRNDVNLLIVISVITIIPTTMLSLVVSVFQALQRFDILLKVKSLFQILSFVINIFLIILFNDFIFVLIIIFIMTISQTLLLIYFVNKIFKNNKNDFDIIEEDFIPKRRVINYAKYMYVNVLWQQVVFNKSEIFFLGIYSTPSEIAIYGIAFGLINISMLIFSPLMNVLNSFFSTLIARNDIVLLEKIINKISIYFIIILMFIFIYVLSFSKELILFVYTNQYIEVVVVFLIMFSGYALMQIISVASSLPFLMEKQKTIVKVGILVGIFNVFLDFLIIPKYGAVGASIANTSSQLVSSIITFLYVKRLIKINLMIKNLYPLFIITFFSIFLLIINYNNIYSKLMITFVYSIVYITFIYFRKIISLREILSFLKLK